MQIVTTGQIDVFLQEPGTGDWMLDTGRYYLVQHSLFLVRYSFYLTAILVLCKVL